MELREAFFYSPKLLVRTKGWLATLAVASQERNWTCSPGAPTLAGRFAQRLPCFPGRQILLPASCSAASPHRIERTANPDCLLVRYSQKGNLWDCLVGVSPWGGLKGQQESHSFVRSPLGQAQRNGSGSTGWGSRKATPQSFRRCKGLAFWTKAHVGQLKSEGVVWH